MASRGRSTGARRAAPARTRAPPHSRRVQTSAPAPRRPLSETRLRPFAEHPDATAALLLALVVFAYLWPVLVGGKILSPIVALYQFTPWNGVAPGDAYSYYNSLLIDIPFADYPWRFFARGLIRAGTLPAWNPHVFAGTPFYANPQTGIFSPFSLPLWILPLNYGIGVAAALKLWVGGFGTYLLVRRLRLGFLPGLLAAVSFAFCAMNIVWLTHETLPAVAVMLPWMVLFVERIFERGGLGDALALALATAIALGGGHPGVQVHVLVIAGLYVVARASASRHDHGDGDGDGHGGPRPLRALALAGGGLALGALLMAVMLVPEALSSHDTIGTLARKGGKVELPGSEMPFDAIKTTLLPDWWGRPSAFEAITAAGRAGGAGNNYNERTFYAGVVALLFAGIGLAARGQWRRKAPFALLGFVGLAIPLHAPGLYWLVTHLPVLEVVQSQRLDLAFLLAVAVLGAFGLQTLIDAPAGDRRRLAVPLVAIGVGIVAAAASGASVRDAGHVLTHFLTGADFKAAGVLALTSVAWLLLFAVAVALAVLAARHRPQHRQAVAAVVVLLAVGDMLHFAHGYQPMGLASKVIPPVTPAIAYLERHKGEGRITGVNYAMPNDWSLTYGFDDVRGYDPPQPTVRYFRLWREANPTQIDWQPFALTELSITGMNVMGVLGARYVVTEPSVDLATLRRNPVVRVLTRVYHGPDATIFENARALPRAMVAPTVVLTADEAQTRAAIADTGFDPHRTVLVERDQPGAAALASAPAAHGSVAIAHDENASVTLRASLQRRGLVVLNDDFMSGWTVRVDGRPAQPLHVNDVMRGVVVPAGSHEVVWSYAVPGLRTGLLLSLLGLAVLAGGGLLLVVRARR